LSKRDALTLRKDIVKTMALLYQRGLVTPTGGNVSGRVPGSRRFWITPSGLFKGGLRARDVVEVGPRAKASFGELRPSTETPMHSKIYAVRDDVRAIVHAHSPVTLGAALAGIEIKPITPEGVLFVGEVPIIQFETPGSEDLADRVADSLRSHQVAVMQNHGVVAVGRHMVEALNRLEVVELTARIMTVAHVWGGKASLSPDQMEKLKHLATA
jgi:L-ribulose-5-phosphate 4-epimerase